VCYPVISCFGSPWFPPKCGRLQRRARKQAVARWISRLLTRAALLLNSSGGALDQPLAYSRGTVIELNPAHRQTAYG